MRVKLIFSLLVACLVLSLGVAQAQSEENSCKSIKFLKVTPKSFECMKKKLQDYGINVPPGNRGELSGQGVTADFEWDGRSVLTITVKEKPNFITCDAADEKLIMFVDKCKGP